MITFYFYKFPLKGSLIIIPDLLADGSILLVVRELAVVSPARAANGRPGADCAADLSIHSYFPRSATKLYYS